MINDGTNFAKSVVSWRTSWYECVIVDEVDVPGDVTEAVPHYSLCYGRVVKSWIMSPVILDAGKFVYSHEDTKSHIGP